ncbi:MAG: tetratricopeptide repeat protein [Cytophagales bacterium]|nr:MAG: tetratricopeptide repeat protein [Cytophagales bacterium]TAF61458.1 MAG: tetratricopeptide repeat protein [Cytophagales bacterium]
MYKALKQRFSTFVPFFERLVKYNLKMKKVLDSALFGVFLLIFSACSSAEESYLSKARNEMNKKQYAEVIRTLSTLLQSQSTNPDIYNLRGSAFFEQKKYTEALSDFQKAVELSQTNYKYFLNRAHALRALKKYGDALKDYEKAAQMNGAELDIFLNKGIVLLNLGRFKEALADLNKANGINPNEKNVLYYRGLASIGLQDYQKAVEDLENYLTVEPTNAEAHFQLAYALITVGGGQTSDDACHHLNEAARMGHVEAIQYSSQYCKTREARA